MQLMQLMQLVQQVTPMQHMRLLIYATIYTSLSLYIYIGVESNSCTEMHCFCSIINGYRAIVAELQTGCIASSPLNMGITAYSCMGCISCKRSNDNMSAKLTIEEVRRYGEAWGLEMCSPEYINSLTQILWRCNLGHCFWRTWKRIKHNQICPNCNMLFEKVKHKIKARGGSIVRDIGLVFAKDKIEIQCAQGHIWNSTISNIATGRWCPVCAKVAKIPYREILESVQLRHGQILKIIGGYKGIKTRMFFRCEKGHEWETKCASILYGSWCPTCRERVPDNAIVLKHRKKSKAKKKKARKIWLKKNKKRVNDYQKEYRARKKAEKAAQEQQQLGQ